LQSWQQLPVSAIANFQPVLLQESSPEGVQKLLRAHPYLRFPFVEQGKPVRILTRKEAEASLAEKRPPKLEPAVTCLPNQTIRELQSKLIDSTSLMVVVLNQPEGTVLGLVTLHDLLRAEVAIAKEGVG
jgi:CIC family chloride channel protein